MAYTKQNFENGQILTAEQLNHMEQGIAAPDWNDVTNKPFYDLEPWIPPVTLPASDGWWQIYEHDISPSASDKVCLLKENTTYIVNFNGTDYECETFTIPNFQYTVFAGNRSRITSNFPDNGQPFLLISYTNQDVDDISVNPVDSSLTSCTISIRIAADPTTKRIDPKYLPLGTPCVTEVVTGAPVPAQYTYDGKAAADGCVHALELDGLFACLERVSSRTPEYFGDDWENHPIGSTVEITEPGKVLTNISIDSIEPVEGENGGYLVLLYSNTELVNREAWGEADGQPFLVGAICYGPDVYNGLFMPSGVYLRATEEAIPVPSAETILGDYVRHPGYVSFLSVLDSETYPEIKANKFHENSVPSLPFIKLYDSGGIVFYLAVVEGELKLYPGGFAV